jgi:hypothetical protein
MDLCLVPPQQQHARRRAAARGDDGRPGARNLALAGVVPELGHRLVDEAEAVGAPLGELPAVRVDGKLAVERDAPAAVEPVLGLADPAEPSPSMSSRVRPASATAARQASTVSDSGSTISRRPIADRPTPDSTARCSNRSPLAGGRGAGRRGSPTRSAVSVSPVGSNSGSQTSSAGSNRTMTSWPMWTSSGSHPTTLVVRWTVGSSASATLAMTYGGSKPGSHRWRLTVNATTVPRPDTAVGSHERLRQAGHTGTGGWTSALQSWHCWIRRRPSAPEVQNHSLAGVSWGSGRTVRTCWTGTRRPASPAGTTRRSRS